MRRLAEQTRGRPLTGRSHQDADDVTGTAATDDAHGFDPLPLLRALHDCGARVAVIGQVAAIMHGSREETGEPAKRIELTPRIRLHVQVCSRPELRARSAGH